MALRGDNRESAVTLLPRPGTQHPGELTILDVIPADVGAIGGTLPLDGVVVYLESSAKQIREVAEVQNRAYYFDKAVPGEYDMYVRWVNWGVSVGHVTVSADKHERKDISLDDLTRHIQDVIDEIRKVGADLRTTAGRHKRYQKVQPRGRSDS